MNRIITFATERGIETIYGEVLRENEPMLRMAKELGFTVAANPDEPGVIDVRRSI
jgi:acetyltransferase